MVTQIMVEISAVLIQHKWATQEKVRVGLHLDDSFGSGIHKI